MFSFVCALPDWSQRSTGVCDWWQRSVWLVITEYNCFSAKNLLAFFVTVNGPIQWTSYAFILFPLTKSLIRSSMKFLVRKNDYFIMCFLRDFEWITWIYWRNWWKSVTTPTTTATLPHGVKPVQTPYHTSSRFCMNKTVIFENILYLFKFE